MGTVLVVNRETMGAGDDGLGARLLQTLLGKALALGGLEAIVFYNGGVRVLGAGSPHLPGLAALEENGVDLIACGTCVKHFEMGEALPVGEIGSMDAILKALAEAEKVVTI